MRSWRKEVKERPQSGKWWVGKPTRAGISRGQNGSELLVAEKLQFKQGHHRPEFILGDTCRKGVRSSLTPGQTSSYCGEPAAEVLNLNYLFTGHLPCWYQKPTEAWTAGEAAAEPMFWPKTGFMGQKLLYRSTSLSLVARLVRLLLFACLFWNGLLLCCKEGEIVPASWCTWGKKVGSLDLNGPGH